MNEKISLLVIDPDTVYAKEIADCAKSHKEFLDADFTTTGTTALRMIEIIKPTVIVISFLLPELDAIGILRRIKAINTVESPFVIITAHSLTPAMISTATEHGADYFIMKPQPSYEVCDTIVDLLSAAAPPTQNAPVAYEESLDVKISHFLHHMGVPAHLNGYRYIRTALQLIIEDISMLSPITQKLYPELADIYEKTPESIERSIRHAIQVSWERGNKKILRDVFGITPGGAYQSYPTNSEYLAMLADDLRLRIKHNVAI